MSFDLRNVPNTIQLIMDVILSADKWQFAIVHQDNIIMFTKSTKEHIEHIREVLAPLRKASATLQLKNCLFLADTRDYSGHVIVPRRLKIAMHTAKAIPGHQSPTLLTDLRSFLNLCNIFRRFEPYFPRIAALLNKRLCIDEPVTFGTLDEKEMAALKALENALQSPPVLALPYAGSQISLDTDACDVQVGFVSLQKEPDKKTNPILYCSRLLNNAEREYDTTQLECFAIIWSVLLLRAYLGTVVYHPHGPQLD